MLCGPLPAISIALLLLAASTLDAAHAQDITRALNRRAALGPPVEPGSNRALPKC